MHRETVTYEADGLPMRSELFLPEGAASPRPGVLVFPDAFGLGEHARERAERVAGLGYAALACDIYGGAETLSDVSTVMGRVGPLMKAPDSIRRRAAGGLQALLARSEVDSAGIAAIGFCFGGTMALELARSGARVAGVVGFHSGLATARPEDARSITGKVLVCLGADDPTVGPDQRQAFEAEMRAGGVDWQMTVYGGVVHSFTNPDIGRHGGTNPAIARYDAKADRRSWAEMCRFFDEIFAAA
jgi:dienelactone hydrolase